YFYQAIDLLPGLGRSDAVGLVGRNLLLVALLIGHGTNEVGRTDDRRRHRVATGALCPEPGTYFVRVIGRQWQEKLPLHSRGNSGTIDDATSRSGQGRFVVT